MAGAPKDREHDVICRRCLISGKVQGVFFRAATQQQAQQLQISGHAINLPDGRVEVLACGATTAVKALIDWLWQGPRHAQVEDIEIEDTKAQPSGFTTY